MPSNQVPTDPQLRALYDSARRLAALRERQKAAELEKKTADALIQSYRMGRNPKAT